MGSMLGALPAACARAAPKHCRCTCYARFGWAGTFIPFPAPLLPSAPQAVALFAPAQPEDEEEEEAELLAPQAVANGIAEMIATGKCRQYLYLSVSLLRLRLPLRLPMSAAAAWCVLRHYSAARSPLPAVPLPVLPPLCCRPYLAFPGAHPANQPCRSCHLPARRRRRRQRGERGARPEGGRLLVCDH